MKKILLGLLVLVSVLSLAACGNKEVNQYFATVDNPVAGWNYYVVVTTKGEEITEVIWDAYNTKGDAYVAVDAATPNTAMSKYQASVAGLYNMGSDLKWHEQADLITKKLIETQDFNDRVPAPAGATITTDDFYTLVEKALASEPVAKGEYKDGYHFISNKKDASATPKAAVSYWDAKTEKVVVVPAFSQYMFAEYIVVNGTIVFAYFDASHHGYAAKMDADNKIQKYAYDHDNNPETAAQSLMIIADYTTQNPTILKTKNELGYSYAMKKPNGLGTFEFFEASKTAAKYLVENQVFPTPNADGDFDNVAGMTITASEFVVLTNRLPKNS